VDRLPAGLAGYYADSIDRWRASLPGVWEDSGLTVLATLAAARDAQPAAPGSRC
jgi:hypothetical protein